MSEIFGQFCGDMRVGSSEKIGKRVVIIALRILIGWMNISVNEVSQIFL